MSRAGRLSAPELALLALILCGGLYLAWDWLRPANGRDDTAAPVAGAPAPAFTYSVREDGMEVGEVEPAALARFLESRGIPPLGVAWPPIEAAVARRFEAALKTVEAAPTADALGQLGQLFDALQMNAQALATFEEAARLAPDSHRWRHYLGRSLQLSDQLERAEAEYRRAIELRPDYLPTRWRLASLCSQQGRIDEAAAILRETLAASMDSYPYTELAVLELQRDDAAAAKALLEEALKRGGRLARAHAVMSQALAKLDDAEGAERHAELGRYSIKSLDPIPDPLMQERLAETDSVAYHRVAARSQRFASPQEAVETWERICRADPANADDKIRLCNAYFDAGRPQDAIRTIEEAIALYPRGARFWLTRAQLAVRMNDAQKALSAAEQAIALDDRLATAHGLRALVLRAVGRFDEAVDSARRQCELLPEVAAGFQFLGETCVLAGRIEEARAAYLGGHELAPDSAALRQALAALDQGR